MSNFDHRKYPAFQPIKMTSRRWPDRQLEKAPLWCSVDLRDGNQALIEPMTARQKSRLWDQLVKLGFKEIDVKLEYRFYSGYNMLRHGYFGHTFDGGTEIQFGVSRKPFGLLPYASHNWFFDITYYLGMEDDSDA